MLLGAAASQSLLPSNSIPSGNVNPASLKDPPEYSNKTIRNILQLWEDELNRDIQNFDEQADRVSQWENQLLENQKTIEDLVDRVHILMVHQEELDSVCEGIEAYQTELASNLEYLDAAVEKQVDKFNESNVSLLNHSIVPFIDR